MKTNQPRSNTKYWIIILILTLIIAGLVSWWYIERQNRLSDEAIDSYQKCIDAGYPVLETYPEQCKTDDGRTFTRIVGTEIERLEHTSDKGTKIQVNVPQTDEIVASPFSVIGQVPGSWTFEGNFSIEILDKDGKSLVTKPVQVNGEWTTEELVPFDVTIDVGDYQGAATLVIHRDNPSDLPENDDSVRIEILIS